MSLGKRLISTGGSAGITGTDHFDTATYAGNGSSSRSFSSLSFSPDFVWIKSTGADPGFSASPHVLYDSVRGAFKALDSNAATAQQTMSTGFVGSNGLISFDTNGFTVGSHHTSNSSLQDYVFWSWKGGGSAVSNTDGTVTSSVSANTDAGFSIVKATAPSSGSFTVGHGLSTPPSFYVIKNMDSAFGWVVYVNALGNDKFLQFNSDSGAGTSTLFWNNTAPSSTVFQMNAGQSITGGDDFIAYCFHDVAGYQKIGTYSGQNTSQSITELGFAPRFVVLKNTTGAGPWVVHDTARSTSNPSVNHLRFNSDLGNDTGSGEQINFDSDGFTLNANGCTNINCASNTFLYWAIA
tara:strand:- start:8059 stop:9111 length:1053 start_codon:yes stop_codon:yes gene_type:complete